MKNLIINSSIFLSTVGFFIGIFLAIAAKRFRIETDPMEEKILEILPKANCGACGFPGCREYAHAILYKNSDLNKCVVCGEKVAAEIANLLGRKAETVTRKIAVIMCNGGPNCTDEFFYSGERSCYAASLVFEGPKSCKYGCLGFGDCAKACPFDAIKFEPGKVPEILWDRCTGCGICAEVCPKKIIEIIDCKFRTHVRCKSLDKGRVVTENCLYGCIGCGLCVKSCPISEVVMIKKTLAKIKYEKCDNCGLCATKCPTKCITVVPLPHH